MNLYKGLSATLFTLLGIIGVNARAFPDTIRHGYTNCTTCHVSPTGGGLLNSYGRSLSRELISTWGYKNEEQPLHGLVNIPESASEAFFVGGDARSLFRRAESSSSKIDEHFLMQEQLRLGFAYEKIKALMSIGKIENPRQSEEVKLVSSEYYLLWNVKEEVSLRAGRFEPIYGLRMPDHNLWVKSEIGAQPWSEKDSVEFIFEGEKQFLSLAGFQATSAMSIDQQTTGYTASLYQIFNETSRAGMSAMNTEGQGIRTKAFSLHGTFTFSEKAYSLVEFTRASFNDSVKDVGFIRLGYELTKGFTPLVQAQSRIERRPSDSEQYKLGAGFIWFPRPHFEIMLTLEELKISQRKSSEGLLLLHYYL